MPSCWRSDSFLLGIQTICWVMPEIRYAKYDSHGLSARESRDLHAAEGSTACPEIYSTYNPPKKILNLVDSSALF